MHFRLSNWQTMTCCIAIYRQIRTIYHELIFSNVNKKSKESVGYMKLVGYLHWLASRETLVMYALELPGANGLPIFYTRKLKSQLLKIPNKKWQNCICLACPRPWVLFPASQTHTETQTHNKLQNWIQT